MKLQGRVYASDAKIKALCKGNEIVIDNTWLEANVEIEKYHEYEEGWTYGITTYHYVVDIDDIDYAINDDFDIDKVLEIIDADWQVMDEWREEPDPEREMERKEEMEGSLCA